jgi:hypothetical protein
MTIERSVHMEKTLFSVDPGGHFALELEGPGPVM